MRARTILLCAIVLVSQHLLSQTYGWKKVAQLPTGVLTFVFIDSLHGWGARGSDEIYRTTDGGNNWVLYGNIRGFGVYSISFADSLTGWCVGTVGNGYIIKTTDGGETWVQQLEKIDRWYRCTHAFSRDHNITAGKSNYSQKPDTGIVVTTTDGGKAWKETPPWNSIGSFIKIQFLDSLNGFILNSNTLQPLPCNLRTRDGGKTWESLPPRPQIQVMTFIDTLRGWGGYDYVMFQTTDGGMTWNYLTYLDQPDQLTMQDVDFTDSLNGWAFGYTYYKGGITDAICRTTDGGHNWLREEVGLSEAYAPIGQGQMLNEHLGWAICSNGSVLKYQQIISVVERLPEQQPKIFTLRQNYPNPFNPATTIEYELQNRQDVTLYVSDAAGRRVETILSNTFQEAGVYRVTFDGTALASGTYFYTIQTESYTDTKQMGLIK